MDDEKLDIDIIELDEEEIDNSDQEKTPSTPVEENPMPENSEMKSENKAATEALNEELDAKKELETLRISKDELLEKTYNLSEDLENAAAKHEEEEEDDKSVIIFIAFIFAFLASFILALPLISRIFE